jgi:hypothetical protein
MIVAVLLSLALGADQPAASPPAPSASTPPHAAKGDMKDPNRIICRREEVVGSHRPQKTCMTKHEWDISEEQARTNLKDGGIQAIAKPLDFGGVK